MKYLLLLTLISCASEEVTHCTLIKRKEINNSLVLIYACGEAGDLICRTEGDKTKDCIEELNRNK